MSIEREYASRDPLIFGRVAAMLPVSDLDRAAAFYADVVGLQRAGDGGEPGRVLVLRRDGAELHLALAPAGPRSPHAIAHLLVSDALRLHDHLLARRATIVEPLLDVPMGQRRFVFADPDGNRVEVGERP